MDPVEARWNELVSRIVAGEVEDLDAILSHSPIVSEPLALERARAMLDRFWDMIQQDPARAAGMAQLTVAVVKARGAPTELLTEALRRQATAAFALGRGHEAAGLLEEGLEILRATVDAPETRARRATLLTFLANAQLAMGLAPRALVSLEEAIHLADTEGLRPQLGVALSSLGNARLASGETRAAGEDYERALLIAREVGNREGEAVNLNNVGLSHHALGELEEAEELYEQAMALAKAMGAPRIAATLEANLGLLCADRGELERAHQHYDAGLELARSLGDMATQASIMLRLARVKREVGSAQAGVELTDQVARILAQVDYPRRSAMWDEAGRARLDAGDVQGAAALFQQAQAAARTVNDRRAEAIATFDLGRAAARAGHAAEAVKYLESALALARDLEDRDLLAETQGALAVVRAAGGRAQEAGALLEQAQLRVAERGGSLLAVRHLLAEAAVAAANGDRSGGAELLGRVLLRARERGFWALVREAEQTLQQVEQEEES